MTTRQHQEPSAAAEEREQQLLDQLDALLSAHAQDEAPMRIRTQEQEVILPESVVALLRQAAHELAQRKAVTIVPHSRTLTTQGAADILNVSRPYLIRLLDQGCFPYTRTGTHRRIRLDDLMQYKAKRDATREQALDELTQINQAIGLYETDE